MQVSAFRRATVAALGSALTGSLRWQCGRSETAPVAAVGPAPSFVHEYAPALFWMRRLRLKLSRARTGLVTKKRPKAGSIPGLAQSTHPPFPHHTFALAIPRGVSKRVACGAPICRPGQTFDGLVLHPGWGGFSLSEEIGL